MASLAAIRANINNNTAVEWDPNIRSNISSFLYARELCGIGRFNNNNHHNHYRSFLGYVGPRTYHSFLNQDEFCSNYAFVQRLQLAKELKGHHGCVNTIQWSTDGSLLLTGSDDLRLLIWSVGNNYKLITDLETGHSRNIFCATFVPGSANGKIVSTGADGEIRLTDVETKKDTLLYTSLDMVLRITFVPGSESVFLSSQQDGTIRRFDLRMKPRASTGIRSRSSLEDDTANVVVDLRQRGDNPRRMFSASPGINCIDFCPQDPNIFAAACGDPYIRQYDARKFECFQKFTVPSIAGDNSNEERGGGSATFRRDVNVTGLSYSTRNEIVATYSGHDIYLFDAARPKNNNSNNVCTEYIQKYSGHRNVQTFLKEVVFIGSNCEYVASGSDCGNIFIWEKKTGELVQLLKGDQHVVNQIAPHPYAPFLASCGIDYTGKVWECSSDGITFSSERARRTVQYNKNFVDSSLDEGSFMSRRMLLHLLRTLQEQRRAAQAQATTATSTATTPPAATTATTTTTTTAEVEMQQPQQTTTTTTTSPAPVPEIAQRQRQQQQQQQHTTAAATFVSASRLSPPMVASSSNAPLPTTIAATATTVSNNNEERMEEVTMTDATAEVLAGGPEVASQVDWPSHNVIEIAEALRTEGNELFKQKLYEQSLHVYTKAVEALDTATPATEHQRRLVAEQLVPCLLNRAACLLQMNAPEYSRVVHDCTRVLSMPEQSRNVKALFRRGTALMRRGDFELAEQDLRLAAEIEPNDKHIKALLVELRNKQEEHKMREKKAFKNLFK